MCLKRTPAFMPVGALIMHERDVKDDPESSSSIHLSDGSRFNCHSDSATG